MSGDIFFLALVFVTFLHQFFRFRGRFPVLATSPRLSQTPDTRRSSGGWGAGRRVWTLKVGLSRVRAGSFLFLVSCAWLRTRFLAVFVGLWAVCSLARALLRLQIPCQRET